MENGQNGDLQSLGSIFLKKKTAETKKPPAYPWQDLALRVMKELLIPNFKRSSVFKICRDFSKEFVERCLNDTKELCPRGEKWKYFFKVVNEEAKKSKDKLS
jgi:hypothetical protein